MTDAELDDIEGRVIEQPKGPWKWMVDARRDALALIDEIRRLRTMTESEDSVLVPKSAISAAWVAAVANLNHPYGTCNPGIPEQCFVCEALAALKPYHHPGSAS